VGSGPNEKGPRVAALIGEGVQLQRGFDFEAPGFQKRLGDVLRVLVLPRPFAQPGGADVLIRLEFEFLHHLLKLGDGGHDRADRLGFAPIRIAASFCHACVCFLFVEILSLDDRCVPSTAWPCLTNWIHETLPAIQARTAGGLFQEPTIKGKEV